MSKRQILSRLGSLRKQLIKQGRELIYIVYPGDDVPEDLNPHARIIRVEYAEEGIPGYDPIQNSAAENTSQRAIADMVGTSPMSIGRDLGNVTNDTGLPEKQKEIVSDDTQPWTADDDKKPTIGDKLKAIENKAKSTIVERLSSDEIQEGDEEDWQPPVIHDYDQWAIERTDLVMRSLQLPHSQRRYVLQDVLRGEYDDFDELEETPYEKLKPYETEEYQTAMDKLKKQGGRLS